MSQRQIFKVARTFSTQVIIKAQLKLRTVSRNSFVSGKRTRKLNKTFWLTTISNSLTGINKIQKHVKHFVRRIIVNVFLNAFRHSFEMFCIAHDTINCKETCFQKRYPAGDENSQSYRKVEAKIFHQNHCRFDFPSRKTE